MTPLLSQEQFETLLRPHRATSEGFLAKYDEFVGIAFGAEWCGPCRRLDKDAIVDLTPGVKWYYCDVDENNYTPGYCGVSSIPSFTLIKDGMFVNNKFPGAQTPAGVAQWVKSSFHTST